MSLASALAFWAVKAPSTQIIDLEDILATGASPIASDRLAKSLLLNVGSVHVMIVMRHDTRLDNQKCRLTFNIKPRMLAAKVVETSTGHAIDGVSPIGMACKVPIYFDVSLRHFEDIYFPAGCPSKLLKHARGTVCELSASELDRCQPSRTNNARFKSSAAAGLRPCLTHWLEHVDPRCVGARPPHTGPVQVAPEAFDDDALRGMRFSPLFGPGP